VKIGIEIGGTKIQVAAGDAGGTIAARHRFSVDKALGADGIRANIASAVRSLIREHAPSGIGVGFGGPFERTTGTASASFHIAGWDGFPLCSWLHDLSGLPVAADNDANTAALAEAGAGAGRGYQFVFYTTLGSGVGGGMVCDGALYHGARPGETEIGHVRLSPSGKIVEDSCSGWAVDRKVAASIAADPGSILASLAGASSGAGARFLAPALAQGCAAASAILDDTCDDLAWALSHVCHLLNPEIIVLGGGLSLVGEPLRSRVAARLPGLLMKTLQPGPAVALTALGEDSVVIGALMLAP